MTSQRMLLTVAPVALCVLLIGCNDSGSGATSSSAAGGGKTASSFVIDGKKDAGCPEAILQEAGIVGRGPFGHGIDIKQVYMDNDDKVLYLFLRTTPSIAQRYNERRSSGSLVDLYVDTDNDPATGCKDYDLFGYGPISGFERKIVVPLGVVAGYKLGEGSYESYFITCDIQQPTAGGQWENVPGTGGPSGGWTPDNIKDSDEGVEMVISLETLNIPPGGTIRILLKEQADPFVKESCNVVIYRMRKP
ncbi:hypothetical protein LCGC14_0418590 [marine sediment metagenome]|uniref:Uncharacterized protein n=1 Tax=marine sediment metagenome TaxID=412755 RepID=A0A0F9VDH6_9ZZZZ|nr:hypothetical protein [Phycisphaerae bacterium]HDZ42563.1 hypothetical protein [Phycisphaerae bacterium]